MIVISGVEQNPSASSSGAASQVHHSWAVTSGQGAGQLRVICSLAQQRCSCQPHAGDSWACVSWAGGALQSLGPKQRPRAELVQLPGSLHGRQGVLPNTVFGFSWWPRCA